MEKTYIFGHQNPDTDSVTSAISLSYLKNKLGDYTSPRILGDINNETKFVLDFFKFEKPKYLNDVKLRIRNLDFEKNYFLFEKESIYQGFNYMSKHFISTLPIVDENKKFIGLISMKDIAKDLIFEDNGKMYTSFDNIIEILNGTEVCRFEDEIEGNILVPSYRSTTFINTISIGHDSILIMGDRHSIHEFAVNNFAKLIILTKNSIIKDEHLQTAIKNKVNIIRTPLDTFKVSKLIHLCNYISTIVNKNNIIYFKENDYIEEFIKIAEKTKFSNYPILNDKSECLGVLSSGDINSNSKRKVILVDHNEKEQSVIGLEEAEIVEIVDHHKIGTITTSLPISFRNMPVGSTNTIVFYLFRENNIEIPKNIAGIMMAGIISDTLLLSSPTATNKDKEAIEKLSEIADIDYQTFAMKMFEAGSSLKGLSKEDIIYSDFKNFTIKDNLVGVGQILTTNPKEILNNIKEYQLFIENESNKKEYQIFALFVTDILNKGSFLIYNSNAEEILKEAFKINNLKQGFFITNCLSRKKQIIPKIIDAIEKSN